MMRLEILAGPVAANLFAGAALSLPASRFIGICKVTPMAGGIAVSWVSSDSF